MGVPAETFVDRFGRSDLMFLWLSTRSVSFRLINSRGPTKRACQDFSFFLFLWSVIFAVFVGWVEGGCNDDWLGSARGNGKAPTRWILL